MTHPVRHVKGIEEASRLEETLRVMTEQLAALSVVNKASPRTKHCYKCGKLAHIVNNYHSRNGMIFYNCGRKGHSYQNCWSQGNSQGGVPKPLSWGHFLELNNA